MRVLAKDYRERERCFANVLPQSAECPAPDRLTLVDEDERERPSVFPRFFVSQQTGTMGKQ